MARLRGIQRVINGGRNQFLLELEKQLDNEHNQALRRGNSLMSKMSMLVDFSGDRNTSYFHTKAITRRHKNQVAGLKDADSHWAWDDEKLQCMATESYRKLLTEEGGNYNGDPFFADFPRTDSISKDRSVVNLTDEEVRRAVFDMKAPGPDGFQPCFYQSQWIVVGQDVCQFVRSVFNNENLQYLFFI